MGNTLAALAHNIDMSTMDTQQVEEFQLHIVLSIETWIR